MAKLGRPTVLTPAVVARLIEAFKCGSTRVEACASVGIGLPTFQRRYVSDETFRQQMDAALAEYSQFQVGLIQKSAMKGRWEAAAWLVDRQGKDERLEEDGDTVAVAHKLIAALEEAGKLDPETIFHQRAFLMLAAAVDQQPKNAALWRQCMAAADALRGAKPKDDSAAAALEAIFGALVRPVAPDPVQGVRRV